MEEAALLMPMAGAGLSVEELAKPHPLVPGVHRTRPFAASSMVAL
jgi:hypothetical protein